ncbi:MAG: hypothetical protein ACR2NN_29570 [Bryobacteraceae bacterium]
MTYWAGKQKDGARRKPQVSAGTIFEVVVYQAVLGKGSLLQEDQWLRTKEAKALHGSKRTMVVSDTTMLNALGKWDLGSTREALYARHLRLRDQGQSSVVLSTGKKITLGIVDGTQQGVLGTSALAMAGEVYHLIDAERSPGRGHELKTSRRLLLRAVEHLGEGFASHIVYDGLAADRVDLAFVHRRIGAHLVVKTQEETLVIIQRAKAAWENASEETLRETGAERVSGTDKEKGVDYVVVAQGGIVWAGLKEPLKLAWVKETHHKGKYKGQTLTFWTITTDESLTAMECREIAHDRWAIETNGFKELNEQVGSKKRYIKNLHVKEALVLIWGLGMSLLKAYQRFLETQEDWIRWGVKKTKKLLAQEIIRSLHSEVTSSRAPP